MTVLQWAELVPAYNSHARDIDEMVDVFRQLSNDDQQRMIEIGRALLPFKKKKPMTGDNAGG